MNFQMINIIFSILLFPMNIFCSFWLFQESLSLTNMTFYEFISKTRKNHISFHTRHRLKRIIHFFEKYSSNPKKSLRFLWLFQIATLTGVLALNLAFYVAINPKKSQYIFCINIILFLINSLFFIVGKIYQKKHHNKIKKTYSLKSIIVYLFVGLFFFLILFFFMIQVSLLSSS